VNIDIVELRPLAHQSNRLFDVWLDGRHLSARLAMYLPATATYWLSLVLDEDVQRAQQGTLDVGTIDELPANTRLRRYLARVEV
jgi:hypothetical protein